MHQFAKASLFLVAGLGSSAVIATDATQLSVVQVALNYQSSFVDVEQLPAEPLLGSLTGWVGQTLSWEFRSTFPDPQATYSEQTELGGTSRDWYLPNSSGTIASREPGSPQTFLGGLSLGTGDNLVLVGAGGGLADGTYDGLIWDGYAPGTTFTPGVGVTGVLYRFELVGSASMLTAPTSPVLSAGTLDVSQIRLVSFTVGEFERGTLIGSAGASGSLDTLNVAFTPQGALSVTAVPEPGTWVIMLAGLAALGALCARRGRR